MKRRKKKFASFNTISSNEYFIVKNLTIVHWNHLLMMHCIFWSFKICWKWRFYSNIPFSYTFWITLGITFINFNILLNNVSNTQWHFNWILLRKKIMAFVCSLFLVKFHNLHQNSMENSKLFKSIIVKIRYYMRLMIWYLLHFTQNNQILIWIQFEHGIHYDMHCH